MTSERRAALIGRAEAVDAWIVENEVDDDYRFTACPQAPLYLVARTERVIYCGRLSKPLPLGLRINAGGHFTFSPYARGACPTPRDADPSMTRTKPVLFWLYHHFVVPLCDPDSGDNRASCSAFPRHGPAADWK